MEQTAYKGPERRSSNAPYNGPERRRLDWPFKPLTGSQRDEGVPDKATPGRPGEKP